MGFEFWHRYSGKRQNYIAYLDDLEDAFTL